MANANLTRDQAIARAAALQVEHYRIELDLTDGAGAPSQDTFRSVTTVTFAATTDSTFIELIADSIESATLNGQPVDVAGYSPAAGLPLTGLTGQNELVIDATLRYSNTGEGLHRFVDPTDNEVYLYTQFETADAKRMFACFDQPDLKATYTLVVTAPAHWQVISNAPVTAANTNENGSVTTTFDTTVQLSTYLVALIAGPYAHWHDEYTDEHGTIPLGIYCRESLAAGMDADRLFTETKQGFGFYHKNFGQTYPFGKYDQLFVPEFNAGAMENAGAVTFLEDYVFQSRVTSYLYERRAETVLHEMAHMWFGDLVTMRWWDDLWLNESFATFASVLSQAEATEYTNAWTTFASVEKAWAYRQDALPSTHPIAADIPDIAAVEVNFDGITYAKGASVLKQLVAYVGLDPFLAGLRSYFAAHKFGNASFSDLLHNLEQSSGRDLSDWGQQWLKTTGINELRPVFDVDPDNKFISFAIEQGPATPGAGETRVHRLRVGIYDDVDGTLQRVRSEELDVEGPITDVPQLVGVDRGQLVLVNDDDLTYGSIALDEKSLQVAIERIGDITDSLPRALLWSATWQMTRNGQMRARDFVTLVNRGVGAETEISVLRNVLLQANTALNSYADPTWAASGWVQHADRLWELARAAEPGSDHQLAFVAALIGSADGRAPGAVLSAEQLAPFAAILAGTDPAEVGLDKLTVDTDLRWSIVAALAQGGVLDDGTVSGDDSPTIDAELQRKDTAATQRYALAARAARPVPAIKESYWTQAFTDDALANITTRAITQGLVRAGQADVLRPFTGSYFDGVTKVWERRSSEVAQTVVIGLYPSWDISQEALDQADALLQTDLPPALKRLIIEGRDGVARSRRLRAVDAG